MLNIQSKTIKSNSKIFYFIDFGKKKLEQVKLCHLSTFDSLYAGFFKEKVWDKLSHSRYYNIYHNSEIKLHIPSNTDKLLGHYYINFIYHDRFCIIYEFK